MQDTEIVYGVLWHLECMALSANAIDNFRPPADVFQMRMHYSVYITNLISAIDVVYEKFGKKFYNDIEKNIGMNACSGESVHSYVRELRNGVTHRGIDPACGGVVVDGIVRAIAIPKVSNRACNKSYDTPANLLHEILMHFEINAKPVLIHYLDPLITHVVSVSPESILSNYIDELEGVRHMPEWAKGLAREHTNSEVLIEAQCHQISKLRDLLKSTTWTN